MKILYFPCHEMLAYDDLRMFTDAGHKVFSLGEYASPSYPWTFRRPLPAFDSPDDFAAFQAGQPQGREKLKPEFASRFDVAIVNNFVEWANAALEAMPGKTVIYRSIGLSTPKLEKDISRLEGRVKIVRYSNLEVGLPGFAKTDRVIYFGKHLDDYSRPWIGGERVLTFHNNYPARHMYTTPGLDQFTALRQHYPMDLWGSGNEAVPASMGIATPEQQIDLLRTCRVYFHTPVAAASYTLMLLEAMAAGAPILAPSAKMVANTLSEEVKSGIGSMPERYEVEDFLDHNPALLYDSLEEARVKLDALMVDATLRQAASDQVRAIVRSRCSASDIGQQWTELFEELL